MGLGPGLGQLVSPGNLNLGWNDIIWVSGLSKLGYLDFPCQSFYLLSHQYLSNKVHSCLSDRSRCLDFSEYEEIELGNTSACVLSILRVCNCLLLIMR